MKRLSSLVVASVLTVSASAVAVPQQLCDDHGKKGETKEDKKDDKDKKDAKGGGDTKPKPPAFY